MTTVTDINLLTIIAGHIDDMLTWHAFALTCKKTARIARLLKDVKMEQFEWLIISHWEVSDDRVDCKWHGRFTKGWVSCRGTRLWFLPRGMQVFYDEDCDNQEFAKFEKDVLNPHKDFPGDYCQLRNESLEAMIEALEDTSDGICRFVKPDDPEFVELLQDHMWTPPKADKLLTTYYDMNTVWIVKDLEGTLKELHRVLEYCQDVDVTFDWV